MSDPKPDDPYNVQYWSQRWDENRIGFHQSNVNPNLLKYMELITGRKLTGEPVTDPELFKKNSEKSWFVPLCGKTLDIPYLLSQVQWFRFANFLCSEIKQEKRYDIHNAFFSGFQSIWGGRSENSNRCLGGGAKTWFSIQ